MQTKSTKPKTSLGCSPSSGYNLTACRQGNAEASKNLLNVETPSAPLDRGCISRKRFLSRKERKARKEMEDGNERPTGAVFGQACGSADWFPAYGTPPGVFIALFARINCYRPLFAFFPPRLQYNLKSVI
ncbi:MAG: hypothetical protein IJQ39_13585 [Thermoguttaceae bacterium]|nr:hypothetical protein [Thermoguttaceae bacterium]